SKPSKNWRRLCLNFVMTCWGFSPSGIPSAKAGWKRSKKKRTDRNPAHGAPVYFDGPTAEWHVAVYDKDGYVYSNDFKRSGKIDRVKITDIERGWGVKYLGWTEDYCGVRDLDLYAPKVPDPGAPPPASGGTSEPRYDDDMEEFLMTADWKRYSTTKVQKLKKVGQWQYLYTTDKNNISFADGPARVTGHVAVIIHGKPGESVYFRVVEDDEDAKGKVTRRATYSDHVEVTITPGSTYAKFPINVNAGAAKKGYKGNWIRVQWHSSDPNCKITRAEVGRWSARQRGEQVWTGMNCVACWSRFCLPCGGCGCTWFTRWPVWLWARSVPGSWRPVSCRRCGFWLPGRCTSISARRSAWWPPLTCWTGTARPSRPQPGGCWSRTTWKTCVRSLTRLTRASKGNERPRPRTVAGVGSGPFRVSVASHWTVSQQPRQKASRSARATNWSPCRWQMISTRRAVSLVTLCIANLRLRSFLTSKIVSWVTVRVKRGLCSQSSRPRHTWRSWGTRLRSGVSVAAGGSREGHLAPTHRRWPPGVCRQSHVPPGGSPTG